jgi:hypothetical protein
MYLGVVGIPTDIPIPEEPHGALLIGGWEANLSNGDESSVLYMRCC